MPRRIAIISATLVAVGGLLASLLGGVQAGTGFGIAFGSLSTLMVSFMLTNATKDGL